MGDQGVYDLIDGEILSPQETAELARVSGLPDVSREELKKWYGVMHLGRVLDDKAPNYLKQGLGWSYHAPCAGHDAIQLALGMTFRTGRDYLFPYYRDLTTCLAAGLTAVRVPIRPCSRWKRRSWLKSTLQTPSPYVSMKVPSSSHG